MKKSSPLITRVGIAFLICTLVAGLLFSCNREKVNPTALSNRTSGARLESTTLVVNPNPVTVADYISIYQTTQDYRDINLWATLDYSRATLVTTSDPDITTLAVPVTSSTVVGTSKANPSSVSTASSGTSLIGLRYAVPYNNVKDVIFYWRKSTRTSFTLVRNISGTGYYDKPINFGGKLVDFAGEMDMLQPTGGYVFGGKLWSSGFRGYKPYNVPPSVQRPKYKSFNACYQAVKDTCEKDWVCDVACSINPCFIAYILVCVKDRLS